RRRAGRALRADAARKRRHPGPARSRPVARARGACTPAGEMTEATWRLPPIPVLLVAVALIACAEVGGAAMAQFKLELARWARGTMLARPQVHGLVGVRDVDEQILDEALVK